MYVYTLFFKNDVKQIFLSTFLYSIDLINKFSFVSMNITEIKGMKLSHNANEKLRTWFFQVAYGGY